MSLRAVVFDFDGVLADTEALHLQAYQDVLAENEVSLSAPAYYARYLGYDDEGVFKAVGVDFGKAWASATIDDLVRRKASRLAALVRDRDVLFPGAARLIAQLAAEVPLAIASGALRREIEDLLEATGLRSCFCAIVAAGETAHGKPAPDPYARAAALLAPYIASRPTGGGGTTANPPVGAPYAHIVAIEDSHWGIESARAAGLRCVAVAHTYAPHELDDADLVVANVGELSLAVLREVCRGR